MLGVPFQLSSKLLLHGRFAALRYFPDVKLFLPQGAYTDAHTFAHLSGYHVVQVKEPAHHGAFSGANTYGAINSCFGLFCSLN